MRITFTEDIEDIRERRTKIMKEGSEILCTRELAEEYIDLGVAVLSSNIPKDVEVLKDKKAAIKFQEKEQEKQ